jgi:hypothetical protein
VSEMRNRTRTGASYSRWANRQVEPGGGEKEGFYLSEIRGTSQGFGSTPGVVGGGSRIGFERGYSEPPLGAAWRVPGGSHLEEVGERGSGEAPVHALVPRARGSQGQVLAQRDVHAALEPDVALVTRQRGGVMALRHVRCGREASRRAHRVPPLRCEEAHATLPARHSRQQLLAK